MYCLIIVQDGRTALHHAVEHGVASNDLQMARLLLSYGADANIRDEVRCFRILIETTLRFRLIYPSLRSASIAVL